MHDTPVNRFQRQLGAQFKNLDVLRFDVWLQRGEINMPAARGKMIARGRLHIVQMEPRQPRIINQFIG